MKKIIKLFAYGVVLLSLSGCMATQTALNDTSLQTHTKMTDSIFLEPVPSSMKTVYVETRNTSDQQNLSIKSYLVSDLQKKGYKIVGSPTQAHYLLQVNILKAGKVEPNKAKMGVDGTVSGAAVGATAGAIGGSSTDIAVGAIAGALVGNVANAMFKNIGFIIDTDVQISERAHSSVHQSSTTTLKQGTSTTQTLTSQNNASWNKYRTRVISSADKMNLKFDQASPYLSKDLANTIANIFA
ncbi:MAG: hypothetical protein CMF49_04770 [Legionellales bacterium]|nr:hypothetical protein [Legionellales bacterium]|tara:strand:- start:896 stop:1618 length:723 start_codon:yes stop_codon:yes gene_type:complete